MSITIHSVKYFGVNPNQALAMISIPDENDGEPFGYFIALDHEDDSPIYQEIISKIRSGEVEIQSSDIDMNEYNANKLRLQRNELLNQTDKYMVIDTVLSDDEVKEMKIYRKALRDISSQKSFPNVELPQLPNFLYLDSNGKIEYLQNNKQS